MYGCTQLGAVGCGAPSSPAPSGDPSVRAPAVLAPLPLALQLGVPAEVSAGTPVPLRLALTNTGDQTVKFEMSGHNETAFDFVVTDVGGAELWRRTHGRTALDVVRAVTLLPGASLVFAENWDQRDNNGRLLSPGTYQVRGIVVTVELPDRQRTPGGITVDPLPLRIAR